MSRWQDHRPFEMFGGQQQRMAIARALANHAHLILADESTREETKKQSKKLVVILLSGRPRVITEQLPLADAWVAAWLPGTEGGGVADVLFGDFPFTGKLSYSWPRSNRQLPINVNNSANKTGCEAPLFPFGYGLTYDEFAPEILECP